MHIACEWHAIDTLVFVLPETGSQLVVQLVKLLVILLSLRSVELKSLWLPVL